MDQLPTDMPDDIRAILLEPVTMLDFMEEMLGFTQNLTNEQPRFKKLLQYLHRTMGQNIQYAVLGIEGFDGQDFTDWEAFSSSIKQKVYDAAVSKDQYNIFSELHYTLEFYGIVKGKPKKQKFMSLLNDGKHAFYAGYGHILVTNDKDMMEKSRMVYKIHGLDTVVISLEEFKEFLKKETIVDKSASAMLSQRSIVSATTKRGRRIWSSTCDCNEGAMFASKTKGEPWWVFGSVGVNVSKTPRSVVRTTSNSLGITSRLCSLKEFILMSTIMVSGSASPLTQQAGSECYGAACCY
jgi:hypothetical protein